MLMTQRAREESRLTVTELSHGGENTDMRFSNCPEALLVLDRHGKENVAFRV